SSLRSSSSILENRGISARRCVVTLLMSASPLFKIVRAIRGFHTASLLASILQVRHLGKKYPLLPFTSFHCIFQAVRSPCIKWRNTVWLCNTKKESLKHDETVLYFYQ